jgi:mono/diheme cytochrome c family protein
MRTLFCFIALSALHAQDDLGARVFLHTCAQGYCHGAAGQQGRAPKLLGRAYDPAAAMSIIADGIGNTGMPGFKERLTAAELTAVVAYVVKISGGDASKQVTAAATTAAKPVSADAKRGRELFFDATRGVNRCGTCHALDGLGLAIGPNLASGAKYDLAAIRRGRPASVMQASINGGDSFPALIVERNKETMRVYDLSAVPPPLRVLTTPDVGLRTATNWSHATFLKGYTEAELKTVIAWLDTLNGK